ncbi:hypothetical protein [Sphingomonas sp. 2SG]|jgi:phage-related minor tail protein|uniref:hypothetical protein n=1 Tax=Sphingomonas sp. 2SG TaxID=2502201 RepID=UPI0010F75FD9|nr:hypothetical protein [Sphingomonas sp. 2SG]
MKRLLILAAPLAVGLAACSQNAQNETADAANAIAADTEATTRNAVSDVDVATDRAFGSAERHIDNAGDHLDNAAAHADDRLDRAGDAISNGADRAADATGNALERAGRSLKN